MKKILGLCLALATTIGFAGAAKAQDPPLQSIYFRVYNRTDRPITYQVFWFDQNGHASYGGWVTWTVQPGATNNHWVLPHNNDESPVARLTYYDYLKNAWTPPEEPNAQGLRTPGALGFVNEFHIGERIGREGTFLFFDPE